MFLVKNTAKGVQSPLSKANRISVWPSAKPFYPCRERWVVPPKPFSNAIVLRLPAIFVSDQGMKEESPCSPKTYA